MTHRTLSIALALVFSLAACKLSLDGKDLNKKSSNDDSSSNSDNSSNGDSGDSSSSGSSDSEGSSSGNKWADTRDWKDAVRWRPEGHPAGAPWTKLHVDSTPSNSASELKVSCDDKDKEDETCNGLDDDCDGQVDEECGVPAGGLQISMAWETYNSVDMVVKYATWDRDFRSDTMTYWQNNSEHAQVPEISLGKSRNAPTLKLGPDAQGNCACKDKRIVNSKIVTCGPNCSEKKGMCLPKKKGHYAEWASLDTKKAPPGVYTVKFHNNSLCGTRGGEVAVTVSISINGKLVGSYKSGELQVQGFDFPILELYVP